MISMMIPELASGRSGKSIRAPDVLITPLNVGLVFFDWVTRSEPVKVRA